MKALVYLDSPAMATATVAIGRALQNELGAEIEVLLVDSQRHRDQLPKSFAVRDLSELWASPRAVRRQRSSWPKKILKGLLIVLFLPLIALDPGKAQDPMRLALIPTARFVRSLPKRAYFSVSNLIKRFLRRHPLLLRDLHILRASFRLRRAICIRSVRQGIAFIRSLPERAYFSVFNLIQRSLRRHPLLLRDLHILRASFRLRRAICVRFVRRRIAFIRGLPKRAYFSVSHQIKRFLRRHPLLLRELHILRAPFRLRRTISTRFVRKGIAFIRSLPKRAYFFVVNPIKRFLRGQRLVRELRILHSSFLLRRAIRDYMKRSAPDVAIFFEDNIETYTRLFIDGGRRLGIPTVVVPFTIPNAREAANALVKMPEYRVSDTMARHLSRLKSQWVLPFGGHALIRLPLSRLLGVELMGVAVPRPWILNSGSANVIALDSEASRRSYLAVDFPESQLTIVGDPTSAQLTAGLKDPQRLRERLLLTNGLEGRERPLVVCAFPPDQFRGTPVDSYEHATFPALLNSWFSVLTEMSRHANVLVRPHPRLSVEMLKAYETDHLRVTWQPTAELIPAASVYVASISATIRWAVACGIPAINYDCYRYRYDDFVEASGVVTVYSEADFSDTAARFFGDAGFADDLRKKQRAVMGDWGLVDGRFAQRFGALVANLVAPGPRQSAQEAA